MRGRSERTQKMGVFGEEGPYLRHLIPCFRFSIRLGLWVRAPGWAVGSGLLLPGSGRSWRGGQPRSASPGLCSWLPAWWQVETRYCVV